MRNHSIFRFLILLFLQLFVDLSCLLLLLSCVSSVLSCYLLLFLVFSRVFVVFGVFCCFWCLKTSLHMNYEGDNGGHDHDEEIFTIVSIVKVDGTTPKRWLSKGP